jgi:hypothetical protein
MPVEYLRPSRESDLTLSAIQRLSASLRRPFTYGELGDELLSHDARKVERRQFSGALNFVAKSLPSTDPLWTVVVVSKETGQPSDGFWTAEYPDVKFGEVRNLSAERVTRWIRIQQDWCIASALVLASPLDQRLRDEEIDARERADVALIDLRLEQNREDAEGAIAGGAESSGA